MKKHIFRLILCFVSCFTCSSKNKISYKEEKIRSVVSITKNEYTQILTHKAINVFNKIANASTISYTELYSIINKNEKEVANFYISLADLITQKYGEDPNINLEIAIEICDKIFSRLKEKIGPAAKNESFILFLNRSKEGLLNLDPSFPISLTKKEYDRILTEEIITVFIEIGDICENSKGNGTYKKIDIQSIIDLHKSVIEKFSIQMNEVISEKISNSLVLFPSQMLRINLEVSDLIFNRLKVLIGSSHLKDIFIETMRETYRKGCAKQFGEE